MSATFQAKALFVFALALGLAMIRVARGEEAITLSCGSTGTEFEMCREGAEAWSKKTGVPVHFFSSPSDTNERLALYQNQLAAKSSDIDVYQIDVIWPGILGKHFIDLTPHFNSSELKKFWESSVRNNRVEGRLVAIPWFIDGGVFYYRKDLLDKHRVAVPKTWAEMEAAAKKISAAEQKAGNLDLNGFVFQGRAYEGLTCNALEWVSSFGGGTIVDASGKPTIFNPQAVKAIESAASWVGTISPKGVLNYAEEEARGVFQSGKAVFMRNWPYAWALLNSPDSPVKGKVGMSALPSGSAGGNRASTLGGWGLAVSAYSKHSKRAIELIQYLTGVESQKFRAIKAAYAPSLMALYADKEVVKANPHLKELKSVFLNTVPRPSSQTHGGYNQVSAEVWNAVHSVLSGTRKSSEALEALDRSLQRRLGPVKGE